MLWNALKDGLCYLRNENISMKLFLLNMQEATYFIWSEEVYSPSNLWGILNFFHENYWIHLTSSSKWRGSVTHGDVKFWFSRNANTGRYCSVLQFQVFKSCIMSFTKVADTSFNLSKNSLDLRTKIRRYLDRNLTSYKLNVNIWSKCRLNT